MAETFARMRALVLEAAFVVSLSHDVPRDRHDVLIGEGRSGAEGYGVQLTDADGRYRFKTIKPGAYPVGVRNWIRPPHIHFDVTGRIDRIVTQMYFDGELLNEKDEFLQQVGCKECLTAKLAPPSKEVEPDSLMAVWDIVLARG